MRLLSALIAASLLTSCGLNEERYDKQVSKSFCSWQKRCRQFDFYSNFDSVGSCVDAQRAQLDNLGSYYDAKCTYNKDKAKECLDYLGASCKESAEQYEALQAACDAVWSCPDDGAGDTG